MIGVFVRAFIISCVKYYSRNILLTVPFQFSPHTPFILPNLSLIYFSICQQVTFVKHSLKQFTHIMLKNFSRWPILVPTFHMTLHSRHLLWSVPALVFTHGLCFTTPHIHRPKAHLAVWYLSALLWSMIQLFYLIFFKLKNRVLFYV